MDSIETVLLALADLATRATDADEALDAVLGMIATAMRADSGAVALPNPDTGRLEIEAVFGAPVEQGEGLAQGQGLPGWSALHGKPVLASDVEAEPRYRALRMGVISQMAVPMPAADGRLVGVISVDRDKKPAYSLADLDTFTRMAEAAGRAMERIWHFSHLQDKARQLEMLLTTAQSLVSKLEQHELFDTLTCDTRKMMRARACALFLYERESDTLRLASFDGPGAVPDSRSLPLDSCLFATVVHTRRAMAFADIQSAECFDLADLPDDPSLHSVLATPLSNEGGALGVLAVFTERVHRFDDDEKRLCVALANLGTVALQNAQLYARVFASEESLRKNEQLTTLGLLAAEIAHEIRNPLTVLKLLFGGLGLDFSEGDPRRTDMRVIGEKLDQLEAIVTRVLNFAKAPSSLHTRCSLAEIVEDTLVLVRLKLSQSKVLLKVDAPARPLIVDGHKGQLQQVVLNLILNSTQAMPNGGSITLTIRAAAVGGAPVAVVDVADTGTGIPDAFRERIFDSFLSGRAEGTGLGLAIAKRIMLSHRGDISLVSTSPAGTTLRLTLPLVKS